MGAASALLLAALAVPAPWAQAATASDVITATTSSSPTIGIIKTSTSQSVTITLKANVAATAVTLTLTQPGTSTAYTGGGFSFSSNSCTNKSLAASGTCTATLRFLSSTKGVFAADAFYSFTSGSVGYTTAIRFTATAGTLPGSPTALNTTVASRTAMDLAWTPPADTGGIPITGYRISIIDMGTGAVVDQPSLLPSATINGLTPGIAYSLRVYAANQLGESTSYAFKSTTFTLPAPSAPLSLAYVTRSTTIAVSWQAATGFVDGYLIQIFNRDIPADGITDIATVSAQDLSYTLTDLEPSTRYTVKVVAFNVSASAVASVDATTERDLPEAPSDVSATALKANIVLLTWTAPVQDVAGYTIEQSLDGDSWDSANGAPEDPAATEFEITDLDPETHYFFRIRAYNDFGDGDDSEVAEVDTPSGLTNPANNLSAVGFDGTSVMLTWEAPDPSYADTIGYRIETREVDPENGGEGEWEYLDEVSPDTNEYLVTGLVPCVAPANSIGFWPCPTTEYRVISVSDWGDSEEGQIASAEPLFAWPDAPQIIDARATSPGELELLWEQVTGGTLGVEGYKILYSTEWESLACDPSDDFSAGECEFFGDEIDVDADTLRWTISGLDPGHYYLRLLPLLLSDSLGEVPGPASDIVEIEVLGEVQPVEWVEITQVDANTASFWWPSSDSPWGESTYLIELSGDGGETWTQVGETSDDSIDIDGLRSGCTYFVRVTATDRFSMASPSEPTEFTTSLAGAADLSVWSDDDWTVNITWSPSNEDALISGWRIEQQFTPVGEDPTEDNWSELAVVDADVNDYLMTEVQPCDATGPEAICQDLHVRVIGFNDVTESTASPAVKAEREFALAQPPAEVQTSRIDTSSFEVRWQPGNPGTGPIAGYRVYYSTDEEMLLECQVTDFGGCTFDTDSYVDVGPGETSATITDVEPATLWYVVVVSIAQSDHWGDIHGQPSMTASVQVPAPLDMPEDLAVTNVSFTAAELSWGEVVNDDDAELAYTVELSGDSGQSWLRIAETPDTWLSLQDLKPGASYMVRVVAANRFATSEAAEADFHTKSFAKPAQPRVSDFSIDGGGWLAIDPGEDTGATNVVFSAQVFAKGPGGRALSIDCDSEGLWCYAPDAVPGTAYRMQITVSSDGGRQRSPWFTFTPPDVQLAITTGPVTLKDEVIDIEAWNLAPGTAFLVYGRQRMTIDVDADGHTSASFTLVGTGRKVITVMQGSRKATGEVWVIGVKAPYRARPSSTAYLKVTGVAPGEHLILRTSTSADMTFISNGSPLAIPVSVPARGGVDWSIEVRGVTIAEGTVFARER